MVRLFVAVELEEPEVLKKVISFKNSVLACSKQGGIKGVEDENIHLTLRFIGEVPEDLLPKIYECVKNLENISRFNIRVVGVGAFPNLSRPRVVWVGVREGTEELSKLKKLLDACLEKYVRLEKEEFVPHITVGRVKGSVDFTCLKEIVHTYENFNFGTSPVTKVKLKKSVLRPEGPIYNDLLVVNLKEV